MIRRVLVYCGDFGVPLDGSKGASVHLRSIAAAFVECGMDVIVASPRAGNARLPGATIVALSDTPRPSADEFDPVVMSTSHAARLADVARSASIDAVYERMSLWTTAGLATARSLGVPYLVEVNAPLAEEAARWRTLRHPDAAREAERAVARGATRLFAVSDPVAEYLRACGAPPANVRVLPNAVESSFILAGARRLAHTAPPARDPFTICFVGSLKPWHGVDTLLEAFRVLGAAGGGFRVIIAGDGPLAPLVAEAARTTPGIEWTGAMAHEDVPALLARADVAVAPYRDDAGGYFSPLKVVEYMAAGVPVIASGGRGVEELVRNEGTGLLVASGDAASLARAVTRCRDDRALAARLAARAFAAMEHRTWRAAAETVLHEAGHAAMTAERT
jgi:glycosyltransferase involved in cell wall biosynthesis